jgi:hypothetical protein
MHSYRLEIEKLIINNTSIKINDIFSKMNIIAINLIENKKLPK